MRKATDWIMTALAAVLVVSLMFTIPSGAITEDAQMRYFDALWDEEYEDEEARREPVAVLASAVFSDILPAANVTALDGDLFTPGSTPISENFTENGYRDETIIVEMEGRRMFDSNVYIAYVKVATPSQVRTAIAGKKMGSSSTNHTTVISKNYNGIVAINGDYYPKTKAGYIVRMGKTYREQTSKNMDMLLIDELGDFHLLLRGHEEQKEDLAVFKSEHEIVNGFFFGPALVKDGETLEIPQSYQFDPHQKNPRAGIAQLDDLTYALVVVTGRMDSSAGVTMEEFASVMEELGAKQAYNLDGGNSATLAFNGVEYTTGHLYVTNDGCQVVFGDYNTLRKQLTDGTLYRGKAQDERSVTDVIYFASAIGE